MAHKDPLLNTHLFVNCCNVTLKVACSLEAVVAQVTDEVVALVNASVDQFNKQDLQIGNIHE